MRPKTKIILALSFGSLLVVIAMVAVLSMPFSAPERVYISPSGYSVRYPGDWIVNNGERNSSSGSISIREPHGRAEIFIHDQLEPRLQERGGRVAASREVEVGFSQNKEFRLDFFGWLDPDIGAVDNAYTAIGSLQRAPYEYAFREIGLLVSTGWKITMRREIHSEYAAELGPVADAIFLSFQATGGASESRRKFLSAEEAKEKVKALPSFALDSGEGGQALGNYSLEVEDAGEFWSVRLYRPSESIPSAAKVPSARWNVDKVTGAVSRSVP